MKPSPAAIAVLTSVLLSGIAAVPAYAADLAGAARAAVPEREGADPSNVPEQLDDPKAADVTITARILEPEAVAPDAERLAKLTVPEGFSIKVFADGLNKPRMIAPGKDGAIYVTDRDKGLVTLLKDADGDGTAEVKRTVAEKEAMHGIFVKDDTVFLMTVADIYKAPIEADGSFGTLEKVAGDFPDAGQHPNRTLAVGPDDRLYVSIGSTCNECDESSDESATMMRMTQDGEERTIFASGLRNTIGFGFEPTSGALYGFDHGIDWLGDDEQPEEFNLIEEGKKYGWPYVYADGQIYPQDDPKTGTSEDWAKASQEPVLMYTPHAAPMQMAFAGDDFAADFSGDAFVPMRGSWNRKPPSGYEIVRVDFEDGKPKSIEPFISGFLQKTEGGNGWEQMGRLAGLGFGGDGAMYVSDDEHGVVYRIAREP